jgi:hypothetical protein
VIHDGAAREHRTQKDRSDPIVGIARTCLGGAFWRATRDGRKTAAHPGAG